MELKLNIAKNGITTNESVINEEFTLRYGHIFRGEKGDTGEKGDKGDNGKSPKISNNETWLVYSDEAQAYVDTGIKASGSDNNYTDADKALVQTIPNKQDKLTLTTKANGNIVIGNLAGQSKEFMPATPSGDPMHYAYEAAGAEWNASTGYWELNEIANITNSEMRELYNEAYLLSTEGLLTAWFNGSTQRTNICLCRWQARAAINSFGNCLNIEVATLGRQGYKASPTNLNYAFYPCKKLKKIITIIDCNNCTSFTAAFNGCYMLEEVRLDKLNKSISFADSTNLSTESILYMIENATATTAITITLHEDAYMSAMENEDIVMALAEKTKVKLASA